MHEIKLDGICASYNGQYVLENINLSIEEGSIQMVIGPSGAGKTTLLKVMNGLLQPKRGFVIIQGNNFNKKGKLSHLRKNIGYIPQNLGLIKNRTVKDSILNGALGRINSLRSFFNFFPKYEINLADHLIQAVGLKDKANNKIFELSGGEKRRVAIARAFMQKPKILLADEILSDLDFVKVKEITQEIKKLRDEFRTTIVMVEHDLEIAKNFGDKIMILREGQTKGNFLNKEINDKILHNAFAA